MVNKYYKLSKISEAKFRPLMRYFAMDFTATDSAELTRLSRRSVTAIFGRLRRKITPWSKQQAPVADTIELDETYFGPRRIPGKRGRGASGKTIVVGIFKRQGSIPRSFLMTVKRCFRALYEVK